jgi:hypothetical protein
MKTWQAILVTVTVLVVSLFLPPLFLYVAVFGTSLWAAIDSSGIQLHRYKSGIALKPFGLSLGCLLLWIVAFPWYLSVRYRIRNEMAELKEAGRAAVPVR